MLNVERYGKGRVLSLDLKGVGRTFAIASVWLPTCEVALGVARFVLFWSAGLFCPAAAAITLDS